ncbi:hypothetical protein LCI18_005616 [Fusarium solani-melongenae]|uniref:Uncharacterized protein n=1 Tax=Fusarium solani subsp. cucurbitae TaxID=2747967 RepID=A0ACD3Z0K1_FUSSC|nr:hypothetical protein LCI18_005616 [Fusarium solani-melongenae]
MADYNIPDAMLHRVIPSMFNPGDFPAQWVGDNPTLEERRQYVHTYLEWRLPHDDMEKQGRDLRDLAERKAAMKLINENVVEVGAQQFECLVDEMLWHTWLGYLGNTPPFPWPCLAEKDEPENISQSFDKWLGTYMREGELVKVVEPGDNAAGAEQHHLPNSETTATAQHLTISKRSNESYQVQKFSEQVDRLQQELRQQDEQISQMHREIRQRDQQISSRDGKIWLLESLMQLQRHQLRLERGLLRRERERMQQQLFQDSW